MAKDDDNLNISRIRTKYVNCSYFLWKLCQR